MLSAGPTPHTPLATWDFMLRGAGGPAARWTWDEFQALPHETVTTDIHCVTKWSKLDTVWEGVSVDTLLAEAAARGVGACAVRAGTVRRRLHDQPAACRRDRRQGMGGGDIRRRAARARARRPARLLVPHLYFWKSAKWVRQLHFMERDQARILGVVRLSQLR